MSSTGNSSPCPLHALVCDLQVFVKEVMQDACLLRWFDAWIEDHDYLRYLSVIVISLKEKLERERAQKARLQNYTLPSCMKSFKHVANIRYMTKQRNITQQTPDCDANDNYIYGKLYELWSYTTKTSIEEALEADIAILLADFAATPPTWTFLRRFLRNHTECATIFFLANKIKSELESP